MAQALSVSDMDGIVSLQKTVLTGSFVETLINMLNLYKRQLGAGNSGSFCEILFYKQYALLLPLNIDKIIRIDLDNGEIKIINAVLKKSDWCCWSATPERMCKGMTENIYFGVSEFISYICKDRS